MLKLSLYELRKNRGAILILTGVLAALEVYFLYAVFHRESHLAAATALLVLASVICFFAVFLFAMVNYYREMNSRTSYLVFMTPISPERIILSKMITVLLIGLILAGVIVGLAVVDFGLAAEKYGDYREMTDALVNVLKRFGVNVAEITANLIFAVITFLLSFFSTVTLIYLCITLASTLLRNNAMKIVITIVFMVLGFLGKGKLNELLEANYEVAFTESIGDLLLQSWPYTLMNAVLCLFCIYFSALLLRKRLSL